MRINTEYPRQIEKISHGQKSVVIEDFLASSTGSIEVEDGKTEYRDPVPPLETPGYSKFKMTILDSGNFVHCNIPEKDVRKIYNKSRDARETDMIAEIVKRAMKYSDAPAEKAAKPTDTSVNTSSPAFTEKVSMGTLKGLTPVQVVLEKGVEQAKSQMDFYNKNLAKYPANKKIIDAFSEAITLFETGKLNKKSAETAEQETKSANPVPDESIIYQTEFKYLTSDSISDGGKVKVFVYKLDVVKDRTMNLTHRITIQNAYAPLMKTSVGTVVPDMKNSVQMKKCSMLLSEDEWFDIIETMTDEVRNYNLNSYIVRANAAVNITKENIAKSKK